MKPCRAEFIILSSGKPVGGEQSVSRLSFVRCGADRERRRFLRKHRDFRFDLHSICDMITDKGSGRKRRFGPHFPKNRNKIFWGKDQ